MEFQIIRILSAIHTISKNNNYKKTKKKEKTILFLCPEKQSEPEFIGNGISLLVVKI